MAEALSTIARPYARAIFELALSKKALDTWLAKLDAAALVVKDHHVNLQITDPQIPKPAILSLFENILEPVLDDEFKNLLRLLVENERLQALPEMALQFKTFKDEHEGILEARVISARGLTDDQQAGLKQALQKRFSKKVLMTCQVDESLLGGAIVSIDDWVVDGSALTRLNELKTFMSHKELTK